MPEARAWSEECALFYDGKGGAALIGIDGLAARRTMESRERGTKSSSEEKNLPARLRLRCVPQCGRRRHE
jgi:hypothetical protein